MMVPVLPARNFPRTRSLSIAILILCLRTTWIHATGTPATVTTQPADVVALAGQSATFSVVAAGDPAPTFQWQKDYTDIPGATSSSYAIASATAQDAGSYRVKVTNPSTSWLYSAAANLSVRVRNSSIAYGNNSSADLTADNLTVSAGTANSGALTGFSTTTTAGSEHSGRLTGMNISANVGTNHAGEVTGLQISSASGAHQVGRVTGLNVTTTSGGFEAGHGEMTGLKVTVDNPGSGKANAALFMGGKVGIGTLTPQSDLDVGGNVRVFGTAQKPGGVTLSGPDWSDAQNLPWTGGSVLDYRDGFYASQTQTGNSTTPTEIKSSLLNTDSLELEDSVFYNGPSSITTVTKSKLYPGKFVASKLSVVSGIHADSRNVSVDPENGIEYAASVDGEISHTTIDRSGVTTTTLHASDMVITPKWRVASTPAPPDYVFAKDYQLRSLEETEKYVNAHQHLPEIPAAQEMEEKGINVTQMNLQLLKKVEELTLHMIAMDKKVKMQEQQNIRLEGELQVLRGEGKGK